MATKAASAPSAIRTCCAGIIAMVLSAASFGAEPDSNREKPVLTLEAAVHYALENNPTLAYQRQQHGIAAAHVIIADTYPFNPTLENRIQAATGPASAGITNN